MDDEAKKILSRSLVHQIERLRDELAAQADVHTQIQMQLSDERDALRAVVQAAFDMQISNYPEWEALARAALNKGGQEG